MDQVPGQPWETEPLTRTTVGEAESIAAVVTRSVASVRGVPRERLPPLYEAVDPDALAALFDEEGQGFAAFRYHGLWVVVTASGIVSVHAEADGRD